MEKKYELINVNDINGHFRIRALKSFRNVGAGDLGGFVQSEYNLSHEGECWIYDDARVFDNARVSGYARVFGNALVSGYARVSEDARVSGYARVSEDARVCGYARVSEDARVCGYARVYGESQVYGDAIVYGYARVYENAIVCENHHVQFSRCTSDLKNDIIASILVQCNLFVDNEKITCFKNVNRDLSSFHDPNFKYRVGEFASVKNPDTSNTSCAPGLHVSHLTYWDQEESDFVRLVCEVDLKDVITVQEGKMRVKRLFVKRVLEK